MIDSDSDSGCPRVPRPHRHRDGQLAVLSWVMQKLMAVEEALRRVCPRLVCPRQNSRCVHL